MKAVVYNKKCLPDKLVYRDVEDGKIKPVIDRRYPLDKTADAMRYLGEGHAQGKVVINVG